VSSIELTDHAPGPYPEFAFNVVCGTGTYVRTLIDDIAQATGGRAHLSSLRRVRVGSLGLDRSVTIEGLDDYHKHLLSPAVALSDLPRVEVGTDVAPGVSHGLRFVAGPVADISPDVPTAIIDETGDLIAVYRRQGREARPEVVLS
jgi:tRNA pseudouridine55 synthase